MNTEVTARIILRTGKIESINRFHPWVFSGAVKRIEGTPENGDLVELYDNHDHFLALGHYNEGSIIARILSFEKTQINEDFFKAKFEKAWNYRKNLGLLNESNNVFRLIHGEADELPGLIIDFYNEAAVLEFHSKGMELLSQIITKALSETCDSQIKTIVSKSKNNKEDKAKLEYGNAIEMPHIITEFGNKFYVNWDDGQKTGFFIDQRDNRQLLKMYSENKNVLNMFGYTGGFSVYALAGKAKQVTTVDSSEKAIELCKKNIELNNFDSTQNPCIAEDALDFLKNMPNDKYDIIVLDPPAYAKRSDARHNAIQGYKRLNAEALCKINKNGLLFTYSCSQVVEQNHFLGAITAAAISAKRRIKIIKQLTQASCHAHSIFHPEGFYLKGLMLFVE